MAIVYMTQEGYDKKMAELARLENVERPEVINAIREARDKGDLSENAEYDAAKERQGLLEAKIAELKNLVAGARIIDESKISTDEVQLLNRVTIKNVANGAKMTYTIVTETEARAGALRAARTDRCTACQAAAGRTAAQAAAGAPAADCRAAAQAVAATPASAAAGCGDAFPGTGQKRLHQRVDEKRGNDPDPDAAGLAGR